MTGSPAISARGLTKRYGSTTALDDVTFDLPANTICGLFGRNGRGGGQSRDTRRKAHGDRRSESKRLNASHVDPKSPKLG